MVSGYAAQTQVYYAELLTWCKPAPKRQITVTLSPVIPLHVLCLHPDVGRATLTVPRYTVGAHRALAFALAARAWATRVA